MSRDCYYHNIVAVSLYMTQMLQYSQHETPDQVRVRALEQNFVGWDIPNNDFSDSHIVTLDLRAFNTAWNLALHPSLNGVYNA